MSIYGDWWEGETELWPGDEIEFGGERPWVMWKGLGWIECSGERMDRG